jgi:hypothetical protein
MRSRVVVQVERAPLAGARRPVFVRQQAGGIVFDVTDPECPVTLAKYRRRPWFVDGRRLGRLYARLDDTRSRVTIYRLGKTVTGFERPPLASEIRSRTVAPARADSY